MTYNDRGKYDRAREVYSRVVTTSYQAPRNIDPFARGKLANMHADLGAGYASLAMYDEAAREYGNALNLCPEFADLRVRLGAVYRDMGDHDAAIHELTTARDQCSEHLPAASTSASPTSPPAARKTPSTSGAKSYSATRPTSSRALPAHGQRLAIEVGDGSRSRSLFLILIL